MARLTEEQKRFLIVRLACFDTPQQAATAASELFGIVVSRQQVWALSPENGGRVRRALRELYAETRASFMREVSQVPIAHKAVRLRYLQRLYDKADGAGNIVAAMDAIERAAKEVGEYWTNRRILAVEDPAEALARELGIPVEDLRQIAAGLGEEPGDRFDQGQSSQERSSLLSR